MEEKSCSKNFLLRSYDTIIIGAGSMGLATARYLVKCGQKVLLLDHYNPPHTFGSHHGETRLFRLSYAEGNSYVPLLQDARSRWLELEQEMNECKYEVGQDFLFSPTGVINVAQASSNFVTDVLASARSYRLHYEYLSATEAERKWQGLLIPEDYVVFYDTQGGVLFSEACLETYKQSCLRQGAHLKTNGEMVHLVVTNESVELNWGGDRIMAGGLVITAGAGTAGILRNWFPEWPLPLQTIRKTVAWYNPMIHCQGYKISEYSSAYFPGYLIESTNGMFYGFPNFGQGVKVGRHDGGMACTLESINRDFYHDEGDELEIRKFVMDFLPHAAGNLNKGIVCPYTITPDGHFIIDFHPYYRNVVLAAGFSGHGFKFASIIGEILGDMVIGSEVSYDLTLFRAGRFNY